MNNINSLLYGWNGFNQTSNLFQNNILNSNLTTSLIGSAKTGTTLSSQAKGISELYNILKCYGNKNTLTGFNDTIKMLAADSSGKTNLDNFIRFGKDAIAKGKTRMLASMLAGVKDLNSQGNSALGLSIVKQAGETYANQGIGLAAIFTDTVTSIQDRTYSRSSEKTSALQSFIDTWSALSAKGVLKSKGVPDPAAFAAKIKTLDNQSLNTYLSQVSGDLKTGITSSSQAKGISDLYNIMKCNGNKNTLAGFDETIKALAADSSGKTNLDNFIRFGKDAVAKGKTRMFANMLAGINNLNSQGNSALGVSIVKQAGKTYADQGIGLAAVFTDTVKSIQDRTYSRSSEKADTLKSFTDTWSSISAQGVIKPKDVPDPAAFASKIKTLDNPSLNTYLSKVSGDLKKMN